jgi:hypothetical protein
LAKPGCGASIGLGKSREALGEDVSRAPRLRTGEAADRDVEWDGPVETRQVGEVASVPTVDAAAVGATVGTRCSGCSDRQVDGQVVNAESTLDDAARSRSPDEFDWKQ